MDKCYYASSWRPRDVQRLLVLAVVLVANVLYIATAHNRLYVALTQAVALCAGILIVQLIVTRQSFAKRPFLMLSEKGLRFIACNIAWDAIRDVVACGNGNDGQVAVQTIDDAKLLNIVPPSLNRLFNKNMKQTGYAIVIPALRGITADELIEQILQYRNFSKSLPLTNEAAASSDDQPPLRLG